MEYGEVNNEHEPLFEVENSDRAFEEEVLFTGFGTAPTKGEGASVSYDDAQESYSARYTAETIALAFAVTEEAMEDNLYDTFAKLRAKGLARAMANTKQVKAANIYNNGFSDTIGDGAAFFSASHPTISDGLQSNLLGAADLSEATLETALTTAQKTKDDRGILIGASVVSLHIPVDYWAVADKILSSPGNTGTSAASANPNTNAINAIRNMGMVPEGYYINRRFTDTDAWFVKTDVPNGTKMFVRSPLQTKMEPDFDTGNLRFKARERYSFGVSDWRGWYGSAG
jgi:hypothetical protein|eukprot:GHVU01213708.1.p1 GENE.GHVU01213708.1~~GHVU01213708.1.p1  ORF type:complete len:292 (+),score=27.10 GHVU01213708.1:22-876(+)